jgi:uncharacterized membrane protein
MFSLYVVLKFIHILSAITAVGANITYGVWNARSQADPAHLGFTLKGIKFLDDRIANPAYGVLLLTGLVMVFVNSWPITSLWIVVALLLFAILVLLAVAVYSPLLRQLIKLVDAGDTSSPEFSKLSGRNRIMGPAFGVIVVLILAMMVFKPTL